MGTLNGLKQKFQAVWLLLDERTRRVFAANEALSMDFGGISEAHRACGLSRKAIAKGIGEIQEGVVAFVALALGVSPSQFPIHAWWTCWMRV